MKKETLLILFGCLLGISVSAQLTFVEDTENTFTGTSDGDLGFADVDGDGDLDLFQVGYGDGFKAVAELYLNDGTGKFIETNTVIPGVGYSAMSFEDLDGDNDIDLFVLGQNSGTYSRIYLNDGAGVFTLLSNTSFPGLSSGFARFADIDNDGDPDLLLQGLNFFSPPMTRLYFNDGAANFTESADNIFPSAYQGESDFADIDNDGDLDFVVAGSTPMGEGTTRLFKNDGSGFFEEVPNVPFIQANISTVDFADIDNDADPDILISGIVSNGIRTRLYKNDGLGNFSEVSNSSIVNVIFGGCAFGDIDLDNDLDLLIVGRKGAIPDETAKVYLNDGAGNFSELGNLPLLGATGGGAQLGDVNGDGDLDAIISGLAPDGSRYTKLYLNELLISDVEPESAFSIQIFPNPFSESLNIHFEQTQKSISFELVNTLGQVILRDQIKNQSILEIPTEKLLSGLYFLKLSNENGQSRVETLVKD